MNLLNGEKILAKLSTNESLLFLKLEPKNVRKALEIVQLFATMPRSQFNIEKSRLISLIESDAFDGWVR